MKVILIEKVPTLGNVGEIVNVSQGYGRNYLLPQNLAVLADEAHKNQLANQQRKLAKKIEAQTGDAEKVKDQLDGYVLELIKRVGANGKLFGSVTTLELSKELEAKGIHVEKRLISLVHPIKSVGEFKGVAKLFHDIAANFTVKVTMNPKQAQELKEKQAAATKKKGKAKTEEASAKTDGNVETKEELTEEQKLKQEADKILRS